MTLVFPPLSLRSAGRTFDEVHTLAKLGGGDSSLQFIFDPEFFLEVLCMLGLTSGDAARRWPIFGQTDLSRNIQDKNGGRLFKETLEDFLK